MKPNLATIKQPDDLDEFFSDQFWELTMQLPKMMEFQWAFFAVACLACKQDFDASSFKELNWERRSTIADKFGRVYDEIDQCVRARKL